MNNSRLKKKRRKSRLKRFMIFLLLICIPVASYLLFVAYKTYSASEETYQELERGRQSDLREEEVVISKDPISILLIGLENYTTNYQGGRTDSLMVATFNPVSKDVKLVSIPRDTYVYVEAEDDYDKITHAYGAGGRDETIKSVENLLQVPIDYYVEVNFEGFKEIVDEIDGVEVNVPFDFSETTDTHPRRTLYFEEGPATLNGEEALAYARMRKQDPRGDFGRNDRQKEIIKALLDKVSTPENLLQIDDIAEHLGKNVKTNLKTTQPLAFMKKYHGLTSKSLETLNIQGEDTYINDIYYFSPYDESLEEVTNELQAHLKISNVAKTETDTAPNSSSQ